MIILFELLLLAVVGYIGYLYGRKTKNDEKVAAVGPTDSLERIKWHMSEATLLARQMKEKLPTQKEELKLLEQNLEKVLAEGQDQIIDTRY